MPARGRVRGARVTARHPVLVYFAWMAGAFVFFEGLGAGLAGGWMRWGSGILWYRLSCLANDLVLTAGGYGIARRVAGRLWWSRPASEGWLWFTLILAAGATFLLILTRRLAVLYAPEVPPMATGLAPALQRTLLPLALLLFVRSRYRNVYKPPSLSRRQRCSDRS